MASTSEVRKGVVIKHQNDLYVVVEFQHINPGKGAAFVRTRMKHLASGKVIEITYKTSESVEIVSVEFQTMQYLYKTGERFAFMDMKSYEQIEMDADLVGEEAKYLKRRIGSNCRALRWPAGKHSAPQENSIQSGGSPASG